MRQRTSPATTSHWSGPVAAAALEAYAEPGAPNGCGLDAGPMMLASLALAAGAVTEELADRVVQRWLAGLPDQIAVVGAFGGLGGLHAGVRAASTVYPGLSSLAQALLAQTPRLLAGVPWRSSAVAWRDYDLFNGPAGLVLAGLTRDGPTAPFAPAIAQLRLLCDDAGLPRLRAGTEIDPRSAFNIGRVNTGIGHGVAGVVSALRHAVVTADSGTRYRPALARAAGWLARQAFVDARGLLTWPPVGPDRPGAPGAVYQRQAWCYGAPGVAWALWDAGRTLADRSVQELAMTAMRSFCGRFDAELYLDDDPDAALALCHGAAGTLAVADAFARHAGLGEAGALRDHLARYLADRADRVAGLAGRDLTLLNGAGGILSVVLTAQGGRRDWLPQLALR